MNTEMNLVMEADSATLDLVFACQNGGIATAADDLFAIMMPLVEGMADRFGSALPAFPMYDLTQECLIGMMQATGKYTLDMRLDWMMFAAVFMNGQVWNCLRDRGMIMRCPEDVARSGDAIDEAIRLLEDRSCRRPDDVEIAAQLDMSVPQLRDDLLTCLVYRVAREYFKAA